MYVCVYIWQAASSNAPPTKVVSNGEGAQPSDLLDLPKLKGIGRNCRSRFSLYRHLQKHAMQHSDSVSSVDSSGALSVLSCRRRCC